MGLNVLLGTYGYSFFPLEELLEKEGAEFPILFQFGVDDSVERAPGDRLISGGKIRGEVCAVSESGHNLDLENPGETADNIVSFTKNYLKGIV